MGAGVGHDHHLTHSRALGVAEVDREWRVWERDTSRSQRVERERIYTQITERERIHATLSKKGKRAASVVLGLVRAARIKALPIYEITPI